MADKSTFSRLVQAGIVVRDANKAVERLSSLGMGTFVGKPEPPWVKPVSSFRDKPFLGSTKPPLGSVMGGVELELIQPLEGESPWQEFLDKHGEGIHHIAFKVDDLDKEVDKFTKRGLSVLITGTWPEGGFAYFDLGVGGLVIELEQGGPLL